MLTVRELIDELGAEAAAGTGGLDVPIRWVHITELSDPTPWLSGGELILTTGMSLGTARDQRAFIRRLADNDLAGLGFGTGFNHKKLPRCLLDEAEQRDFPVFEIPYETPFIAVTEKAFGRLVNEQYAVLQRAIRAHERLEQLLLEERGLDSVAASLSTILGCTVLVLDGRGELLAERAFRRGLAPEALDAMRAEVRARADSGERRIFSPGHGDLAGRALALPVAAGAQQSLAGGQSGARPSAPPQAWLVAARDAGGFGDFERLTLHQAVTVIALELLRRRVVADTERRLSGDVLSELLSGDLAGADLTSRLQPFALGERAGVLVFDVPLRVRNAEAVLERALRAEGAGSLAARHEGLLCAVIAAEGGEERLFEVAERLRVALERETGAVVRTAAGRPAPVDEVRASFHEARCALEAQALAGGPLNGEIATYRELGSFQLLLSLQDDEALRLYCDSVLGPIETGEGNYGGELMRSLEAFVEENGQWERAAKRLYCHRHTLRYRIRKVEELTGRDLSTARDRIEFWLALRGRELVKQGAERAAPRGVS